MKKHTGLLISVLVFATVLSAWGFAADNVDFVLDEVKTAYARHNYVDTVKLADRALESDPTDRQKRTLLRFKALAQCMNPQVRG